MSEVMKWYQRVVGSDSVNAVADKARIVQTTLNRQVRSGALSAETVVAVARAYESDVLDALVVGGLITAEDIRRHGINVTLSQCSAADIAAEVTRRLGSGGDYPEFDSPIT